MGFSKINYDNNFIGFTSFEWSEELVNQLTERRQILLNKLLEVPFMNNDTIYEGNGGTCVLLLRLYSSTTNAEEKHKYLRIAVCILEKILSKKLHEDISFLLGNAGIYALAAVTYSFVGNYAKLKHFIIKLLLISEVDVNNNNTPNEIIVGWAGYLQALLYAYNHTRDVTLLRKSEEIVYLLINTGRNAPFRSSPIMFEWLSEKYIGFAHGFAGIIYMVMMVHEFVKKHEEKTRLLDAKTWEKILEDVKGCADFLITTSLPSGNFPPTIDENFDYMVQWCHGAPGVVLTFCKAYEVFKLNKYLEAARRACEVVWNRGLVTKGLGLCHGIPGNAYAFLATYRISKDEKYLYNAIKFAEFGWDNKAILDSLIAAPDHPYSLFEGIGGAIYLFNDLLYMQNHPLFLPDFPTFECNN